MVIGGVRDEARLMPPSILSFGCDARAFELHRQGGVVWTTVESNWMDLTPWVMSLADAENVLRPYGSTPRNRVVF